MAGDVLEQAAQAFLEALTDFFPGPQRDALRQVVAKGKRVQILAQEKLTQALAQVDPETILRTIEGGNRSTSNGSATTSPVLPASTPTP
jgi:hypothetical protein